MTIFTNQGSRSESVSDLHRLRDGRFRSAEGSGDDYVEAQVVLFRSEGIEMYTDDRLKSRVLQVF